MFILGLTGSIGMGKSTTAKLFAEEGVPVHDADAAVHALYEGEAAPLIEAAFPGTTRRRQGRSRRSLAQRCVGNPEALKRLEAIVHPLVARGARSVSWPRRGSTARRWRCSIFRCCSRSAATSWSMRWWWSRRRPHIQRQRVHGTARHDGGKIRSACWSSRCRMPKSGGAPISSWIAGTASSRRAMQVREILREGC